MRSQVLQTPDEFLGIAGPYREMLRNRDDAAPFWTHRWLHCWWRTHEADCCVRVVCIHDEGELVAAIPLRFSRERLARLPVAGVALLGDAWGMCDLPGRPESAEYWTGALLDYLLSDEAPRWQVLRLGPANPRSLVLPHFLASVRRRGLEHVVDTRPNPYLSTEGTWEDFLGARSKNFRRTNRRKAKALEESPGVRVRTVVNPDDELLRETVFPVSARSWQGVRGLAVASSPAGRDFYEELSRTVGEFEVHLMLVEREQDCLAYLLGLVQNGVYHAFDTGFDPRGSGLSPGMGLHFRLIEELFASDLRELNFGYENEYKDRFHPANHDSAELMVFRSRLVGMWNRAARRLRRIRTAARRDHAAGSVGSPDAGQQGEQDSPVSVAQ